MRGIIFPISENTLRITFSIRKHTSMLNYFPNELFFSTQWHLPASRRFLFPGTVPVVYFNRSS